MFQDRAKIWVEGGDGGNGCVSFRREAHVPRGGPDGGDGGRGGDVVLLCDDSRRDLAYFRGQPHQRAGRGRHGEGSQRHGARGDDLILRVPPGTSVEGLEGERYDLVRPGQRAVVAAGGAGGNGNRRFKSSTRQAPRFAERGLAGAEGWIELHLRLLADAGLVGLPNAGKSSLLGRLTRAAPKVGDYPFTTIDPVLGTLEADDRSVVIADIPGLIEGAAEGAGLGHEFLAHVERCRAIVHVIEIAPYGEIDRDAALLAYETVRGELVAHGHGLADLPELICLSKADLAPSEDVAELAAEWRERLGESVLGVLSVSAATGEGLDELSLAILAAVPERDDVEAAVAEDSGFEAEHLVYRPQAQGFEVLRDDDGVFRVAGRGIETLIARHDTTNQEALDYLERRLREIGVIAALRRAGFETGGEVRIGDAEFELDPEG
ncbi:GTPase ObgE [Thermoleophilia bacterium SCSIO 60948]|nr:GTPase ObgE [Thermoleophilia bacterium SCSIO 60948]